MQSWGGQGFHADVSPLRQHPLKDQPVLKAYRKSFNITHSVQDFGYALTDLAVETIVKRFHKTESCPYILITNADNIYHSSFFKATREHRENGTSIIGTYFVSHYDWLPPEHLANPSGGLNDRSGRDVLMRSALKKYSIDLGAALWKTSDTFVRPDLRFFRSGADRHHENPDWAFELSDGETVERALQHPGVTSVVLPRILFVHQ